MADNTGPVNAEDLEAFEAAIGDLLEVMEEFIALLVEVEEVMRCFSGLTTELVAQVQAESAKPQ